MTREQAKREIDDIDFYLQHHTDDYSERSHDAMMMAIQALSQEPISLDDINNALEASFRNGVRSAKVEQEPCDDAISREYLFKVLDDFCGHDRTATITLDTLADLVYELPSVTQKSGKWHIAHGCYEDRFWCSCGYIRIMDSRMNEWKYCPVCGGAKMVEPQGRSRK